MKLYSFGFACSEYFAWGVYHNVHTEGRVKVSGWVIYPLPYLGAYANFDERVEDARRG